MTKNTSVACTYISPLCYLDVSFDSEIASSPLTNSGARGIAVFMNFFLKPDTKMILEAQNTNSNKLALFSSSKYTTCSHKQLGE
jgi:hypothetical protein